MQWWNLTCPIHFFWWGNWEERWQSVHGRARLRKPCSWTCHEHSKPAGCSLPFSPGFRVLRLGRTRSYPLLIEGYIFFFSFSLCPCLAVMGTPVGIWASFPLPLNNQPLSESEPWVFLACLFNPLEVLWDHFSLPIAVHNSLHYSVFHKYIHILKHRLTNCLLILSIKMIFSRPSLAPVSLTSTYLCLWMLNHLLFPWPLQMTCGLLLIVIMLENAKTRYNLNSP